MRIQPKENYWVDQLGNSNISLDKTKIYPASIASDYGDNEPIFVYYDASGGAMVLFKGEYTKTNKPCNINL